MERAQTKILKDATHCPSGPRVLSAEAQALLTAAVARQVSLWKWVGPAGLLLLFGWLADSQAAGSRGEDPVLLPDSSAVRRPSLSGEGLESFPESRFGQPPSAPRLGIRDAFGAREAASLDEEERDRLTEGGRFPASLPAGAREPVPASVLKRQGVQEVALIAGDLGFFPKTLFVTRDIPVRLFVTGSSKRSLCVLMDAFGVRKQVRSQRVEEIQFTPAHPGKYRVYCPINGSEGTLVVKDAPLAPEIHSGLYSDARTLDR